MFISGDVLIKTCTGDRQKHLTVALHQVGAKNFAVVEKRLMHSYIVLQICTFGMIYNPRVMVQLTVL